jgi:hypothetical protein
MAALPERRAVPFKPVPCARRMESLIAWYPREIGKTIAMSSGDHTASGIDLRAAARYLTI